MIFVTVGTQDFNFMRLLKAVEKAVENKWIQEEVIAQIGNNKFQSDHIHCIPFLDKDEFNEYIGKARFVISHAGTGSIITALKRGKKVIAVARLALFGEHIDDHQLEILDAFAKLNIIIPLNEDLSDLEEKLKNIDTYNLEVYKSNTVNFNNNLIALIKNL